MAVSGDIVEHGGKRFIVVEVAGPYEDETPYGPLIRNFCVLRQPDDLEGENLTAIDETQATVVGHVTSVPGWIEDQLGMWHKVGRSEP